MTYAYPPPAALWPVGCGSKRGITMATLVTGDRLLDAVKKGTFIKGGIDTSTEGVKYDLRMGKRILLANRGPINYDGLSEEKRGSLYLEPGAITFVLTEEALDLPDNMSATLSPKRRLSHDGILTLGGLFIDPRYQGHLLVGLYNFSTTRWLLRPGKKLIAAVFYELAGDELAPFAKPESITDFPDELVKLMQNYQPVMLESLQETIRSTQRELADLKSEFREQENWKKEFRERLEEFFRGLVELKGQIHDLKSSLEEERKTREISIQSFETRITRTDADVAQLQKRRERWFALLIALIATVAGVAGTLAYEHWSRQGAAPAPISGQQVPGK